MEPIISPWFIYLLGMVDTLITLLGVVAFQGVAALLVYYIVLACMQSEYYESERKSWLAGWKRKVKLCWIVLMVSLPLALLIPSKNTIIAMYVADNITPNNVEKALEVGKDFKDEIKKDIIDLIEGINKAEENGE